MSNQRGSDVTAMMKHCQNFKHGFRNVQARISDLQAPGYSRA